MDTKLRRSGSDGVNIPKPWCRRHMETFSALLAICAGNSPVTGEFPAQMPVTRSFDVFFDLRLNKRLSKQSWDWWFETPWRPLWCHCNVLTKNKSITHQCWYKVKILSYARWFPRWTHNPLKPRQMAAIFQTTFPNASFWMKTYEFRLKFH